MSVCFHFLRCELTHYFCRVAKCHGIVWNDHFPGNKCTGSNDTILSDHCAAQYNASHSHNGIISNRTAVHYRIVSDGHTFSDVDGMSLICMQCAVILHIGIVVNKILPVSPRTTALYQIPTFSPKVTSPTTCAPGARYVCLFIFVPLPVLLKLLSYSQKYHVP